jgi:hypothetical protein
LLDLSQWPSASTDDRVQNGEGASPILLPALLATGYSISISNLSSLLRIASLAVFEAADMVGGESVLGLASCHTTVALREELSPLHAGRTR